MADIKLGASALDGFYVGGTAVDKIYLGDVEVFSATSPSSDLYPWDNAVGPNDIDSNDGWSASSTFFTNSMVSTDVGQDFSIAIEARSTSTSNAGYRFNRLPGLTVGTRYKATIRYKNTSTTTPVQHPFNSWREVSDVTYPGGTFSTGQWVEAEVLFTPNDPVNDAEMRFYPLANAAGGRTAGDVLEISSIIIEEVVTLINISPSAANIDSLEANSYGITNDSEWQENGATRGIETIEVRSGTYSLSVTGARYAVVNFRPVVSYFTTGNRYRFTFYMKSSEPTAFAQILSGFTNFSGGTTGTNKVRLDNQPLSDVNGWKELIIEAEFTGTLPLINIAPRDTTGSSVTVYLDEFKIEEL